MMRYLIVFAVMLPASATIITAASTVAYTFTNPSYASNPPRGWINQPGWYEADLATYQYQQGSAVDFKAWDAAGRTVSIMDGPLFGSTYQLHATLPTTVGATFTLEIIPRGAPAAVDLNTAFFGWNPVDPPLGGDPAPVPEPQTTFPLAVGLGLVLARCRLVSCRPGSLPHQNRASIALRRA